MRLGGRSPRSCLDHRPGERRRHPSRCRSRSESPSAGSYRAPRRTSPATASTSRHTPTPRPARAAAPSAVTSGSADTSTGLPERSACSCMSNRLPVAPPSARSTPAPTGSTSSTSADLVSDRLEGRAREMRARRPAREAADQPARVGPPVRRAEPRQRRYEEDAAGRVDLAGQHLALRRARDHAEAVAQPLQRCASRRARSPRRRTARAIPVALRQPSSGARPPPAPAWAPAWARTKLPVP